LRVFACTPVSSLPAAAAFCVTSRASVNMPPLHAFE
jgi:hypothetical protein